MMQVYQIRVLTTIAATLTAIIAILLSTLYVELVTLITSIELLILPAIYIIASEITENKIRTSYDEKIGIISAQTEKLNQKVYKLQSINELLKEVNDEKETKD